MKRFASVINGYSFKGEYTFRKRSQCMDGRELTAVLAMSSFRLIPCTWTLGQLSLSQCCKPMDRNVSTLYTPEQPSPVNNPSNEQLSWWNSSLHIEKKINTGPITNNQRSRRGTIITRNSNISCPPNINNHSFLSSPYW